MLRKINNKSYQRINSIRLRNFSNNNYKYVIKELQKINNNSYNKKCIIEELQNINKLLSCIGINIGILSIIYLIFKINN